MPFDEMITLGNRSDDLSSTSGGAQEVTQGQHQSSCYTDGVLSSEVSEQVITSITPF